MGRQLQHYGALMRKNWISWKRTLLASCCEILCPVLLMAILLLARLAVKRENMPEQSNIGKSTLFYPLVNYSNSTNASLAMMNHQNQLQGYLNFSQLNFQSSGPISTFLPANCLQTKNDPAKTIVAFGPNNTLTWKIVTELQLLVESQKAQFQTISGTPQGQAYIKSMGGPQKFFFDYKFQMFGSEAEIMDYVKRPTYNKNDGDPGICFGLSIDNKVKQEFNIKLLFDDRVETKTAGIPSQYVPSYDNYVRTPDYDSYQKYALYGFANLQNWIANEVLREVTNIRNASIAMSAIPEREAAYVKDNFTQIIASMFPFFILLMYVIPMYRFIQRIVTEKQSKARESMRMMGLTDFSYWMSWWTFYTIVVTIISILCTIIVSINVIKNSSKGLVFLFFWVFGMSLFGMIILFQSLFSSPRVAAIFGTLVYFGTSFISSAVTDAKVAQGTKNAASLLSTISVYLGANLLGNYESSGIGLRMSNVTEVYQNYKFQSTLVMEIIGGLIILVIGLYLDNVLPSAVGVRKPFYFIFSPSYWCGGCCRHKKQRIDHHNSNSSPARDLETLKDDFETKYIKPQYYEPVSSDLKALEEKDKYLRIEDLKKEYSNGFKAVSGINVKMYNGQIFALLGHNGAGKTTTISMLTGLIESSSGSAEVFGHDLFSDMNQVRSFLGVCPQHDILFDLLTPTEHLEIFCDFKGVSKKDQPAEIQKMLKDADLLFHKDTMAKNLSGGNRRKLSVGIALIGGSKFVLLDEPTAGMDLNARRKLWNMLKNYKNNRIIILTTHYMDEADILGDRIGIMSGGQLVCLGSSLFLKNKFGVGYKLTMVKKEKEANTLVGPYIEQNLGPVKKLHEVSSEITYQIPTTLSHNFKTFFDSFDHDLDRLGIRSYGISVTTLEEVFLQVGHLGPSDPISKPSPLAIGGHSDKEDFDKSKVAQDELSQLSADQEIDDYCVAEQQDQVRGMFFIHLLAVFRKRYYNYRRNFKGLLVEVLIPVLLVIIGMGLSKVQFFFDSKERALSPTLYPAKQRILANSNLIARSAYDISPRQIIEALPNFNDYFDVTYNNYSGLSNATILEKFDEDVFQNRKEGKTTPYRYGSYFIYEANNLTKQFKVANFLNLTSQDVTALYPQFMYEAILKQASGDPRLKFSVVSAPFPVTQKLKDRAANINGVFIVFVLSIGFALIPASIISYILNEREKNLKHMQLISGMDLSAYWISNFIFDLVKTYIPVLITIGLFYAFKLDYPDVWTVFLMYPIGVIPFTYATSFLFVNENLAQTVTIFLHFVFSGIGAIVVFILRLISSTQSIGDALLWVLKIIPSFCLTDSIMFISAKAQLKQVRPELNNDNFNALNMGGDLIILTIHFIFWILVLILIETGAISKVWFALPCNKGTVMARDNLDLDEDVVEEEKRVENAGKNDMRVRVDKFRKVYKTAFRKPLCAVERTSFGLDYGECFALLGVNGAGKSTTFKSLTNDITATSGDITINGMDVRRDFATVRKQIGYCPQHDAIFDLMTVEEHLDYYTSIKGITGDRKKAMVEKQIREMNLEEHRKKPAGTLSGGNKRKLSVAMAVLGNPPIILLDEPSAGMDPEARRFMWTVVARISQQRKQSAVILTTHSMEEAEALSTKMGIMVKGGIFRCFGSSQHIKNKFGTGYEVEVKVRKLKPQEIQTKISAYMLPPGTDYVPFAQCVQLMRRHGVDEFLVGELREDGLGADIYNEAKEQKGMVSLANLVVWLNVEIYGQIIIKSLVESFNQVELLEHYNDYYKIRVPKQNKSIGYVFGMVETRKEEYGVSEYSVSQTTLEQIFQTFAQLEYDATKGIVFEKLPNGQIGRRSTAVRQSIVNGVPVRRSSSKKEESKSSTSNRAENAKQERKGKGLQ